MIDRGQLRAASMSPVGSTRGEGRNGRTGAGRRERGSSVRPLKRAAGCPGSTRIWKLSATGIIRGPSGSGARQRLRRSTAEPGRPVPVPPPAPAPYHSDQTVFDLSESGVSQTFRRGVELRGREGWLSAQAADAVATTRRSAPVPNVLAFSMGSGVGGSGSDLMVRAVEANTDQKWVVLRLIHGPCVVSVMR
jgi:hypothetical protein